MGTWQDFLWVGGTIVFAILFGLLFRRLSKKWAWTRFVPIIFSIVVLVGFEISKQIVGVVNGYRWNYLPFFIFSIFIFAMPMSVFTKGRVREISMAVSLAIGVSVTLCMMVFPELIMRTVTQRVFTNEGTYMNYHTLFFHLAVILFTIFALIGKFYTPNKKDVKWVLILFAGFLALSAAMSHILGVDYARFLNFPFGNYASPIIQTASLFLLYQAISLFGVFCIIWLPLWMKRRRGIISPSSRL